MGYHGWRIYIFCTVSPVGIARGIVGTGCCLQYILLFILLLQTNIIAGGLARGYRKQRVVTDPNSTCRNTWNSALCTRIYGLGTHQTVTCLKTVRHKAPLDVCSKTNIVL